MKEMRVYVIDTNHVNTHMYMGEISDELFIEIAEKQDGVYTLKNFENAFNIEELNTHVDYIRFIEVEI